MSTSDKEFQIGENVVHPQHGLGVVTELQETEVMGEDTRVYVISTKKMELQIPIDRARALGVRRVVDSERAENMLKILRTPSQEEPFTSSEGWLERYEELKRRIREGDGENLAELVRDLDKNAKVYEPNVKEREVLKHAKDLLIQELTVALATPKSRVQKKVDDALKANVKKRATI